MSQSALPRSSIQCMSAVNDPHPVLTPAEQSKQQHNKAYSVQQNSLPVQFLRLAITCTCKNYLDRIIIICNCIAVHDCCCRSHFWWHSSTFQFLCPWGMMPPTLALHPCTVNWCSAGIGQS